MALPYQFANVSQLNTPELDSDFNALGALVTIPCTATGTNTIALTTVTTNTPAVTAYTSLAPQFAFIAAATSNGAVTVNINGIGARKLYKNNGSTQCGTGDIVLSGLYTLVYNSALDSAVGGFVLTNQSLSVTAPTVQRLTSGSGATYTPTSGVARIRVSMVGGGAGGGAVATNAGTNGNLSSFQVNGTGTAWTAAGGTGGAASGGNAGGLGGTGGTDGSTGTLVVRVAGDRGGAGSINATAGLQLASGPGGGSAFFRGGGGSQSTAGTAPAGLTNTGGGGAGGASSAAANSGSGGGGGESVAFWVTGLTSATYTVGASAAGGAAGTQAGGAGGSGFILVEEFYV